MMIFALFCPFSAHVLAFESASDSAAAYADANEVVFAVSAVNIRTGPGTEHEIIGVLRTGRSIRRMAIGSNGWSKVMFEGKVAYIHSSYLSTSRPDSVGNLDDAELLRQIAIANGLNQLDYTAQSWDTVTAALDKGCVALGGNDQSAVDAAALEIKNAVASLVRMDYTSLEAALSDMKAMGEEGLESTLWLQLIEEEKAGKDLLTSGDQSAVDAAAQKIQGILTQIKALSGAQTAPEVIVQEVPVEVPPSDDYCNISTHRVWQVLFFISLTVNVALAAVILIYISKKKRKQRDHTPLVKYDISDDAM